MKKRMAFFNDESGDAIVEATILLPICILMVLVIYYASIFMCQQANMQANLQNTLIYYKNNYSDEYVSVRADMAYSVGDDSIKGVGSAYTSPEVLFPYRGWGLKVDKTAFENFFDSMCGYMFFDTGENITVTVDPSNYVIYKTISATATQTVKPAISLELLGLPDAFAISATAKVVVNDTDELIDNVDFILGLIEDTKFGQAVTGAVDKVAEMYQSLKAKFDIGG